MLKKSAIQAPSPLKEKVVSVPELGGDVLVRGLTLPQRLELQIRKGFENLPYMLSVAVLAESEPGKFEPVYTEEEWSLWGVPPKQYIATLTLSEVIRDLSDLDGSQAEKNSKAQSTDSPAP